MISSRRVGVVVILGLLAILPLICNAQSISIAPQDEVQDWVIAGSTVLSVSFLMLSCMGALFYVQGPLPHALGDGTTPKNIPCWASCCGLSVFGLLALYTLFTVSFVIENPNVAQGPMTTTPMVAPCEFCVTTVSFDLFNTYVIDNTNMFSFDIINFEVSIIAVASGATLSTLTEPGPLKFGAEMVTEMNMEFKFIDVDFLTLGLTALLEGGLVRLRIEGGFEVFGGGVTSTKFPIDVTSNYDINIFGGPTPPPEDDGGGEGGGEGGEEEVAQEGSVYGDPPPPGKDLWISAAFVGGVVFLYAGTVGYNMKFLGQGVLAPEPVPYLKEDDGPGLMMGNGYGGDDDAMTQASGATRTRSKGSRGSGGGQRRSRGSSGQRRSKGSRGNRSSGGRSAGNRSKGSRGSRGSTGASTYGGETVAFSALG